MENEQNKSRFSWKRITFILILIIISFMAGISGEFLGRVYLSNLSYFRDFYFTTPANLNQGEIVISQPRKVVVEQTLRLNQVKNDIQTSVLGIYKKKNATNTLLDKIFLSQDYIGQAIVLTSDGWLIARTNMDINPKEYVIAGSNQKIYKIDKVIEDEETKINFIKIQAQNLPVVKLADFNQVNYGEQVVAYNNFFDNLSLVNIESKNYKKLSNKFDFVSSTQNFDKFILLDKNFSYDYFGTPIFNLQSELLGFIISREGNTSQAVPINYINPIINQVLKDQAIKRVYLGINYIDLSRAVGLDENDRQKQNFGAMIWPNENGVAIASDSPLFNKLVKGDIIISIENQALDFNTDLTNLLLEYNSGQEIKIKYLHEQKDEELNVVLK